MKEQKINHLAVWCSVLAFQALSLLWYSPILFAPAWMRYLGKTMKDFDGESMTGLYFAITGAIFFNYFMAWLFQQLKIDTGLKGMVLAGLLALCCFVIPTFTQDSFSLRATGLSFINSGSILLNFCFSGLVLGSWKRY